MKKMGAKRNYRNTRLLQKPLGNQFVHSQRRPLYVAPHHVETGRFEQALYAAVLAPRAVQDGKGNIGFPLVAKFVNKKRVVGTKPQGNFSSFANVFQNAPDL